MKMMKGFDLEKVSGGLVVIDPTIYRLALGIIDGWYDQNKIGTGCK